MKELMAINRFKVALNAARFPLISTKTQRAVFIPGLDSAPRTPRTYMGEDESVDYDLAQILYAENLMPISNGVRSVGYTPVVPGTIETDFDQIFALRDEEEKTVLYSPAKGKNYIHSVLTNLWTSYSFADIHGVVIDPASPLTPATAAVTYAYVDGRTFVCYSRLLATGGTDASILYWNTTTQLLEPAGALLANLPFAAGAIQGIAASNGYLLIYSDITIAWAPFNGTAFDYEIYASGSFTGAGYQIPEDVQGTIRAAIKLPGGFVLFTTKNAIAATYHSQNVSSPWVFREIASAGGIDSYEQASVEGSLGAVYAYTTTGLQRITLNTAEEVFPDVSDFIASRYIERYDFATHAARQSATSLDFYTKLTAVANRFLVISYGTYPGLFSFALVYDLALKRWGKLRIVHSDCFYYSYGVIQADLTYSMLGDVPYDDPLLTTYAATTGQSNALVAAQHSLAFLTSKGAVTIADWSNQVRATEDVAVAVIGRVQLSRGSNIQLNRAEIEGLSSGRVYVAPSYDGATLYPAEEMVTISQLDQQRIAGCMVDCKNFNLIVEGTFDLSTMILEATTTGKT